MRLTALPALVALMLSGCSPRPIESDAGTNEMADAVKAEIPELILVRSMNTDQIRMWPSMILHRTSLKFFGTANDLTVVGGNNAGLLLSFSKLPLSQRQDFPNYNQGQCFSVEIIYQRRTVRGFLFHHTQSELGRWFEKNLPDKAKYLLIDWPGPARD